MAVAVVTVKASGLYCFVFEGFTAFSFTQEASDMIMYGRELVLPDSPGNLILLSCHNMQ